MLSVGETFKKDAEETNLSSESQTTDSKKPLLTMSSIGKLGRFGNQMFQYAFLRICAERSGAQVECSSWIGQTLFGHDDLLISKRLPPAIERWDTGDNLFDVVPEAIPYLETLAGARSFRVGPEVLEKGIVTVDLWGFFQVHTRFLKPYKEYFYSLFQPVPELKMALENGLNLLRSKGKTIVGIHIRQGDYITEPLSRYTLIVPSKWWCEWLEGIWEELENPVLLLCSDDLDNIVHDFDKFCPVTSKDLDVNLPESMKDLDLEFYIDFFMLSNCDIVGISNSSFSFMACLLNERGKMFVRLHKNFLTKFIVFDPWDSEPILHLGSEPSKFSKSFTDAMYVTYVTRGISEMLKCACIYIPNTIIKVLAVRSHMGFQIQGIVGLVKSLLYTLGWRSIWKTQKPTVGKSK